MNYDPAITILIVDDNPADMFFLREVITDDTNLEAKIFEASTFKEAIELIEKEQIDIILLDLFLPDSSGLQTFEDLNKLNLKSSIIVLSGLKDEFIALQTVRSGAQDFLLKGEYNGRLLEKTIIYSYERKKNQELLESSNEKYRELFQYSPLSLFIVEPETCQIQQSNIAASKLFEYSEEEFNKTKLTDFIKQPQQENQPGIGLKKNGDEIFVQLHRKDISIDKERLELVQVEDITESVLFERNRMEVINSIQDAERRNFAMELHDGLAQELVLMNLYLEQLKGKIDHHPEIDKIKEILNSSMIQSRRLTYNIAPPLLDDGFIEGMKVLFERFDGVNEANITLSIQDEDHVCSQCIVPEKTYNAFRIIQEFLNNSLKHAEATRIAAGLYSRDNSVMVEIEDDGKGFETTPDQRTGMGIKNMKRRAEISSLGFSISSKPDKGTTLKLTIPYSELNQSNLKKIELPD